MPEISSLELAKRWGITPRALRFYESRGLISSRRQGRVRIYSQRDSDRIGRILRAKKLGFTLAEIGAMIDVEEGAAPLGLQLTASQCLAQIARLETQMKDIIEALAELRRIHLALCVQAGAAAPGSRTDK
jgi:DNA-binding transcriptional MerR regulator